MRPQVELSAALTPRGGLGNLGEQLDTRPCAIAYHGASVTVQREGYRPRLHEALCRRHRQEHRAINASVGAIGPVSSVFLLDELAVRHKPDLCLVEYSSQDDPRAGQDELEGAIEGIVAKLRGCGCRVCFVHLYRPESGARRDAIVGAWERVAERFVVPSIDVAAGVRAGMASGDFREEELFRDQIHTTSTGSELVAGMLDRALVELAGEEATDSLATAAEDMLPGSEFAAARVLQAEPTTGLFRFQIPYVELGVGEPVVIEPAHPVRGLAVIVGPESGVIHISSPQGDQRITLWDDDCWYERLSTTLFDRARSAGEPLTIELTDDPVDHLLCRRPLDPPNRKSLKLVGYLVMP